MAQVRQDRQTSAGDDPLTYEFLPLAAERGKPPADRRTTLPQSVLRFAEWVVESSAERVTALGEQQTSLLLWLKVMYGASFVVGLVAVAASIVRGATATETTEVVTTAIFGGISAAIFIAFLIVRPTAGVERTTISNLWMNLVSNTYWTRMAFSLQAGGGRSQSDRDRRLRDGLRHAMEQLEPLFLYAHESEKLYIQLAQEVARSSEEDEEDKAVTVIAPGSPVSLKADKGTTLSVRVETTPAEQALTWSLEGDDDGSLVQTAPGEFQYTRGSAAGDQVTVKFQLIGDDTDEAAELIVKKAEAAAAAGGGEGGDKDEEAILKIVSPKSPVKLDATEGKTLKIKLTTTPPDQAMKWSWSGDDKGSLVQEKLGEFRYTRGPEPDDEVTLKFELASDSDASEEFVVEKKGGD